MGLTDLDVLGRLRVALAGRYDVEREVGLGGSAVVYVARDLRHPRSVAIKALRPEFAALLGPDRFLREIETVSQLQHPHILPLHDSGDADGVLYFVMPFVEGASLRDRLVRQRRLPLDEAVAITLDIASALTFAHEHGVIHRDIKPENILFYGGRAVVADFGIARAMRLAAGEQRLTLDQMAPGTPLYMSPEHVVSGAEMDERSDLYSLACVLYEMISGEPLFGDSSPTQLAERHLRERPKPLAERDHAIPAGISATVDRALAKDPADRFASVAGFAAELRAQHVRTRPWDWRRVAAAVALVVSGAAAAALLSGVAPSRLDPGLYALVPFPHAPGASFAGLTPDQCARRLRESLAHWTDLRLVNDLRMASAVAQAERPPQVLEEAVAVARQVGAGRLIWGDLTPLGDSTLLRVGVYDARRQQLVRDTSVVIGANLASLDASIATLAAVLIGPAMPGSLPRSVPLTRSLEAWHAYAAGHDAITRWDMAEADSQFGTALGRDPTFAHAMLWRAQVRWWSDRPVPAWRPLAEQAVALASQFGDSRERDYAVALAAMAGGQYPEACAAYRRVIAADSLDVVAAFGLGECLRRDAAVVRGPRNSGWRFRTSYREATASYRRALRLAPALHLAFGERAYERLTDMFKLERNAWRRGVAAPPDTGLFAAFPELRGDTVGFRPARLLGAMRSARPASHLEAVGRQRAEARAVVDDWLTAFPASVTAHRARALLLELDGVLDGPAGDLSARAEVARARAAATGSQALALAAMDVRLRLKTFDVAGARRLADSVLAANQSPSVADAEALAALAALTGRARLTADLLARSANDTTFRTAGPQARIPREVAAAALRFVAFVSLGEPRDSLLSSLDELRVRLRRHVDTGYRAAAYRQLTDIPLAMAYFELPRRTPQEIGSANYLLAMEASLARGDTAALRRQLEAQRDRHAGRPPGELALVTTLLEARLWEAIGDTAAGVAHLSVVLEDLGVAPTLLVAEPYHAASIARAMIWVAERTPSRSDAVRWARAARTLWSDADAELQAHLDRLPGN